MHRRWLHVFLLGCGVALHFWPWAFADAVAIIMLQWVIPSWVIGIALAIAGRQTDATEKGTLIRPAAIIFAANGMLFWVGVGYYENWVACFYGGLLASLVFLLLCKRWFAFSFAGTQMVNTLVLLVCGLPLADQTLDRKCHFAIRPATASQYYSYRLAKGDPEAFFQWGQYWSYEMQGKPILRACPRSRGILFQSLVSINSL